MAARAQRRGCRAVELPITFRDRVLGTSKMDRRIATEAARLVLKLRSAMRDLPAGPGPATAAL
jgi:hypothetical protein